MAASSASSSPSSPDTHSYMQCDPAYGRSTWRGGPRPPIAGTSRRTLMTKDDLDGTRDASDSFADRLFVISLSEYTSSDGTLQANSPNRADRRRGLDLETEQRWQHVLELHRPRLPHLETSSGPTSATDSRVSFFGPREPRRPPKASPLTPHTPHTPFTPFTPDTPELETPDDDVPGSLAQNQKLVESDSEDSSLRAPETMITPFPLWEYPINPTPGDDLDISGTGVQVDYRTDDTLLSYASSFPPPPPTTQPHPDIAPLTPLRRFRVVNGGPQDVESSSDSHGTSSTPPSPLQLAFSQATAPAKTPRPRLSIITGVSRVRADTFSRDPQGIKQTIASSDSNHGTHAQPSVTDQLMRKLTTDVLQDQAKYKALLAYRGDEAQQILDSLQVVLDSPSLRGQDRAIILKALTRLSTRSGLYPRCFKLNSVEMLGSDAVDEGRYGNVWKAMSHGQVVCLKLLRTYQRMPTQPLLKMLSHEALLWGQLFHPNILPFYGIYINEVRRNRFGLVSPWMENGNIVNYLKQNPHVPRIPLIHDIASGLQYLHSLNIVHGDIKGNNILVTSTGRACLADFGLSALLGDNILVWSSLGSEPGRSGGTTRWKAPELFLQESLDKDSSPTPASDVYSFASTAYEIFTGEIPFYEIRGAEAVTLKLFNSRQQPSRPPPEKMAEEATDEAWRLLEDCWNHEPDQRPSVAEVLERLERMMTSEQIRIVRNRGRAGVDGALDGWEWDAVSSSNFRRTAGLGCKPSDEELLKVMSMISS